MRIQPTNPDQPTLFDLTPEGQLPPVSQRVITPGCLLPIAPHLVIDTKRACSILGVTKGTVVKLIERGDLTGSRLTDRSFWSIEYDSVVRFCDALRVRHSIADRRPALRPGRRWRDQDLLPFLLEDTVTVDSAMIGMELSRRSVIHMCEEGHFECYRLIDETSVPWRISKSSLFRFGELRRADMNARRKPDESASNAKGTPSRA